MMEEEEDELETIKDIDNILHHISNAFQIKIKYFTLKVLNYKSHSLFLRNQKNLVKEAKYCGTQFQY